MAQDLNIDISDAFGSPASDYGGPDLSGGVLSHDCATASCVKPLRRSLSDNSRYRPWSRSATARPTSRSIVPTWASTPSALELQEVAAQLVKARVDLQHVGAGVLDHPAMRSIFVISRTRVTRMAVCSRAAASYRRQNALEPKEVFDLPC